MHKKNGRSPSGKPTVFLSLTLATPTMTKPLLSLLLSLSGILVVLFTGCRRPQPYPAAMQQAIRLIETRPDSALLYLQKIEHLNEEPEETQMYYHLLCIKAKDKMDVLPTSDSLINRIVAYYESHPDKERLTEAYYQQGGVYRDLHNAPRAIACYRMAITTGQGGSNKTLMGKIYGQMAILFAYQGLHKESMAAARQQYAYGDTAGNFCGMAFACRDMARIYHLSAQIDSAILSYRKGYEIAIAHQDSNTAYSILSELGGVYFEEKQNDSARVILQRVLKYSPFSNVCKMLGEIYLQDEKIDSAEYYPQTVFKEGDTYNQIGAYHALSQVAAYRKDYPKAYQYELKAYQLQDTIRQITKTEEVAKANTLYDYHLTEQENFHLKEQTIHQQMTITGLILSLGILFSAGGGIYLHIRQKRQKAEEQAKRLLLIQEEHYRQTQQNQQQQEQQIKELTEQLQVAIRQNDKLKQAQLEAQKEALESSQQFLHTIESQEQRIAHFKQSDIYLLFHRATDSRDLNPNDWETLQCEIDKVYPQFTHRLLMLYPRLSANELHICHLVKTGIPVSQIAHLLNRSTSAITVARARMHKKLTGEEGSAEKTDKIILDL